MGELFQYAYRINADKETPCHLREIKKGDVFYLMSNATKSELRKATEDAFCTVVNKDLVWSIPYEIYE